MGTIMNQDEIIRSQIDIELVNEAYEFFYLLVIAEFIATILFTVLLWNETTNHSLFTAWLVLTITLNYVLRPVILLIYYHRTRNSKTLNIKLWKYYFYIIGIQSGILWALGGLLFIYIPDPFYRLFVFMFFIGLLGSPGPKLMNFNISYLGYMIPISFIILLLAGSILPNISYIIFLIGLLCCTMILFDTYYAHKLLVKTMYLKVYNVNLSKNLVSSEERISNLINNAPIGMSVQTIEGRYLHVNSAFQELLGYTEEELYHLFTKNVVHPDDINTAHDVRQKILQGEMKSAQIHQRLIRKDGTVIWGITSISLLQNKQGELEFIVQILDDTERMNYQQKLLEMNNQTLDALNKLKLFEHEESQLNKLNSQLQLCLKFEETYKRIELIGQDIFPGLSGVLAIYNKSNNHMETVLQWGKIQLFKEVFLPEDCFTLRESKVNIVDNPKSSLICNHYLSPPQGGFIGIPILMQSELIGLFHLWAPEGKTIPKHQQDLAISFANIIKLALANIKLRESLRE